MAENKNQHFVPQFYLRHFSTSPERRDIAVYNIARKRHIAHATIKGQCAKPFLYGKDLTIEKALQRIEGNSAKAISNILATEAPPEPGSPDWGHLITFIMFQWGRTPAAGREQDALLTQLVRQLLKTRGMLDDEEARRAASHVEARYNEPVLMSLFMVAPLGGVIADLREKILINETDVEFVTSDVAVVMHNQWCEGLRGTGTTGLARSGLQIFLPLSPRHILIRYDPSVYRVGQPKEQVVRITEASEVAHLNELQYLFAEENLYYSGNQNTANSIDKFRGRPRAPRHTAPRSQRLIAADGMSELVHVFSERPKFAFKLPWLTIQKRARRKDPAERANALRPAAALAAELHRSSRNSPSEHSVIGQQVFHPVPDDDEN